MFNIDRYTYVVKKNKITAFTTYRGEILFCSAKCDPLDHFDFESGKKLAAYRLNLKVANKRVENLTHKRDLAIKESNELIMAVDNAKKELEESKKAMDSLSKMFED